MIKKQSSIRFIISLSFIILMVSTLLTIGHIIFSSWKDYSKDVITEMENDVNKDISKEIEILINIPLDTNERTYNLIQNKIVDMSNRKEREAFLAGVIKSSSEEIYSFSYGMENGEYYGARRNENKDIEIYRSNSETKGHTLYYTTTKDLTAGKFVKDFGEFDPRERDWYKIAKEKGKPAFSPLYKHFVKDDFVLSASYPIYNKEGVLEGVLGTHITFSKLNNCLKEIVRNQKGTAYIIEKNSGELIANSLENPNFSTLSDGRIKRTTISEIKDQSIVDAYKKYKKTLDTNVVIDKEYEKIHVKLTEYKKEGLDWIIITAIPESLFTAELNKNINLSIFLSIIALCLSMLIYMKSTEAILKPINHLIMATEKFSRGELLERAKVFKNDEIGKLSKAFNNMAEELYLHINKLEEKVKERTIELEKANIQLKHAKVEADKANEAKSKFLANMSHEIRTPLNAVIGFSELMKNTIKDEKHKSYLETINVAGNSLLLIINDILDLSKIEAGKIELQYKPMKLNSVFKEIKNMFMEKVQSKNIELLVEVQEDFPDSILFDEVRIRQILLNIVGNAVKFTEKGHVKLSLRTLHTIKDISSLDIRISVEDTGVGIPEEEREKIFEDFKQVSGQNVKKFGGTGLGLSITKKLTEMMGGKIFVESTVDKGSTFHIEFYNVQIAATEAQSEEANRSYLDKYNFSDEKVLIADDVETNRFLLKELLSKAGVKVITAENGRQALEICKAEKPAMAIVDLIMPEMDGFELGTKLKENPSLSSIPIIALSASNTGNTSNIGSFDDCLIKPVSAEQLFEKISEYIKNKAIKYKYPSVKIESIEVVMKTIEPEVLIDLRNKVKALVEKLEASIIISTVKDLASILTTFGQKHHLQFILSEGEDLMGSVNSYNIIKIKSKLKQIKKLILEE